jgi:8-oxo-dGTP diphosphatase
MPHIHTLPGQHDHTVTAYIIRVDTSEPKALLHMHKKLNILLPIGGHIELSENPWDAVAHEISEESGYSIADLEVLQPQGIIDTLTGVTFHPYPLVLNTHNISDDHLHSDTAFGFIALGSPSSHVGTGESQDLRWYSHCELLNLAVKDVCSNTRQVYDYMFTTALPNWKRCKVTHPDYLGTQHLPKYLLRSSNSFLRHGYSFLYCGEALVAG